MAKKLIRNTFGKISEFIFASIEVGTMFNDIKLEKNKKKKKQTIKKFQSVEVGN